MFKSPDLTHGSILATGRSRGCINTFPHHSSGLGMALECFCNLGQRIWGIPAVIIGKYNNFFISDKRKKCISRSRNSF